MKEYSLYKAVKIYIEERPPEEIGNLKPRDIAKKFDVSISYLSRSFSKYNFFTLHQFLEIYLFISFDLLATRLENPNVKEALEIMKIKSTSYFIRRYKKRRGETPGQYLKKWRDKRKKIVRERRERMKQRRRK